MSVRAVRGAIQIVSNNEDTIKNGVIKLITAIVENNNLLPDNIISIIFSQTSDLYAANPASALRSIGFSDIPLFCTQEPDISGSMERVIRVMITAETSVSLVPVYLEGAENLRPDLNSK